MGLGSWIVGSRRALEGTVYGTIVALSVIAAGSERAGSWRLATLVAATAIVFWIAHVYARALADSVESRTRLTMRRLSHLARHESAIPLAAVPLVGALVLGALGIMRETRAVWLALGLGVATLGAAGWRYARIEELGRWPTVMALAANLGLGLAVVGLKVAVAH
jgi:hypothetical protein